MFYLLNPFLGQISRAQWWLAQLTVFVLCFFAALVAIFMITDPTVPGFEREFEQSPAYVAIIVLGTYMNFCACLNRLRDTGRSGLWFLAFFVPFVGLALVIYFCGIESAAMRSHSRHSDAARPQQQFEQTALATSPTFGRR